VRRVANNRRRSELAAKIVPIAALVLAVVAAKPAPKPVEALPQEHYLNPLEMALSPDGQRMFVVCEGTDEVLVLDLKSAQVVSHVPVGHQPRGDDHRILH